MKKKILCIGFMLAVMLISASCSEKSSSVSDFCLNTDITINVYGKNCEKAAKAALEEIKRIEGKLSPYINSSEIYKINTMAANTPVVVSDETVFVLKRALDMSEKTNGAFDITVKPLVDLWNITAPKPKVPSDESIKELLQLVNYKYVHIDNNTVTLEREGVQIDLGGAAKGYCADRAVEVLKKYEIKNALLDLGGNIYAMGKSPKKSAWRIGLQDPSGSRGEHFRVEELSDETAVTSGSYERFFEQGGKIYHHILNPQTGYPAESGLISVTVIGKNSFESDMLSTAFFVLGDNGINKIKSKLVFERCICVDRNEKITKHKKN